MNKRFSSATLALTLAASLFCSAAHAAQQDLNAPLPQAFLTQQPPADPAIQQAHGLTRKQVHDQLIQSERDGSLARHNLEMYGVS